ncbi:MAG TPA: ferrochelatase, partial [Rhodospirillaceae bacterium]|nr:ferrochelatase [Rhodospirillaceae bacterium]
MSRTAVVIYNLGGPDSPEAVRPFLKNLFSDPMILRVPRPVRWFLSWLISWRRTPVAQEIYAEIGGRSPILPETEKQGAALQKALGEEYRVFVAMRYWHPYADAVARDVAEWKPDRIVLLPLYPQFSTTTTESFNRIWYPAAS